MIEQRWLTKAAVPPESPPPTQATLLGAGTRTLHSLGSGSSVQSLLSLPAAVYPILKYCRKDFEKLVSTFPVMWHSVHFLSPLNLPGPQKRFDSHILLHHTPYCSPICLSSASFTEGLAMNGDSPSHFAYSESWVQHKLLLLLRHPSIHLTMIHSIFSLAYYAPMLNALMVKFLVFFLVCFWGYLRYVSKMSLNILFNIMGYYYYDLKTMQYYQNNMDKPEGH